MADIFNYPVIDIELKSPSYIGYDIECHQLEDIILNFIVRNQGSLVDLSNYTVELRVKKPLVDGYDTDYIQGKTGITKGTNGTLKIECKNKLTELSGFAKGELRLINTANKQSSTRLLAINILPSTIEVNRSIATSTITVMEELDNILNNAYDVQEDFENKIADANKAKSDLETTTNTAKEVKNNLDTSNANATTTKTALDTLNTTALATKSSLDTLNTTANKTKTDLTTINDTANITKTNLDQSNTTANATKTALDTSNTNATNTKTALDILNTNATITKTDLTTINNTAINTKTTLDTLNTNAQTTKTALDESKSNADISKTNLDSANTLAEHNLEELNKLGDVTDLAKKVQTNTNNISSLETNKTEILNTIGTETMGTTATTLKGAIKEHEIQINNNTTQLNEKANNWLKGKTINVLGDSITAEATGSVTWVTRVSEKLGCTCNNYAIGGRAFTGDNGFWNMVDSMDVNADVNIIMGGVNDYLGGAGLGIKGGNTELTNYYVYDGLEKFAKAMTTKFSKSINIIITPLKAETRSATTYNQYEIVKALYYIADKYNFILIDLYSNAPNYNPNITELKTRFTKDGIHPTQEYVDKYLAPVIVQNLLSINNSGNVAMIEHDFCMAKQSNAETIASGTAELELVLYNNSNQTNNNLMVATNGVKTYEHGIYIININSALYGANASGEVKFSLYINGSMFLQHTLDFNGSANEHKNISVSYSYTLPKNAILTTKVTNNTNASINVFETSLNVIKI